MVRSFLVIIFVVLIELFPKPVMACVEGLSWGMNFDNVERQLGTPLIPRNEEGKKDLFEIRNFMISELPVISLRVRFDGEDGLKQLAYEMEYENMIEVLAGLRHRFGPPVETSIEIDGRSPQQQWIWHTGEDVITAIKREEKPFLLSYRPSLLDPSFL